MTTSVPARATKAGAEKSFLKWVGGKTRYSKLLVDQAPPFTGTYREPFLGSAAVFFELAPRSAVLSDANEDLVICFQEVARDPQEVMDLLDQYPNTPEFFADMRARSTTDMSNLERAARVVYLNKTSFRGLWRVNKRGQFNTPYGAYDRPLYNRATMTRAAAALAGATIVAGDFEQQIDQAETGDWLFLDPPYVPLGGWADFKRYTPEQFGPADHERLCAAMQRASDRGAFVTLTNSDTDFVRETFGGAFEISRMTTRRDINLLAAKRGSFDLVITNYDPPKSGQLAIEVPMPVS